MYVVFSPIYLTKPYSSRELIARIRANTRHSDQTEEQKPTAGTTTLDPSRYEITLDNTTSSLPRKEFELAYMLMQRHGGS
jgi:DNA-binding response OmpR family regulator